MNDEYDECQIKEQKRILEYKKYLEKKRLFL